MAIGKFKMINPLETSVEVIILRRSKELEQYATDLAIDERDIEILTNCINERLGKNLNEKTTADDVLKELSEIIINKYKLQTKGALCELLILLFAALDL